MKFKIFKIGLVLCALVSCVFSISSSSIAMESDSSIDMESDSSKYVKNLKIFSLQDKISKLIYGENKKYMSAEEQRKADEEVNIVEKIGESGDPMEGKGVSQYMFYLFKIANEFKRDVSKQQKDILYEDLFDSFTSQDYLGTKCSLIKIIQDPNSSESAKNEAKKIFNSLVEGFLKFGEKDNGNNVNEIREDTIDTTIEETNESQKYKNEIIIDDTDYVKAVDAIKAYDKEFKEVLFKNRDKVKLIEDVFDEKAKILKERIEGYTNAIEKRSVNELEKEGVKCFYDLGRFKEVAKDINSKLKKLFNMAADGFKKLFEKEYGKIFDDLKNTNKKSNNGLFFYEEKSIQMLRTSYDEYLKKNKIYDYVGRIFDSVFGDIDIYNEKYVQVKNEKNREEVYEKGVENFFTSIVKNYENGGLLPNTVLYEKLISCIFKMHDAFEHVVKIMKFSAIEHYVRQFITLDRGYELCKNYDKAIRFLNNKGDNLNGSCVRQVFESLYGEVLDFCKSHVHRNLSENDKKIVKKFVKNFELINCAEELRIHNTYGASNDENLGICKGLSQENRKVYDELTDRYSRLVDDQTIKEGYSQDKLREGDLTQIMIYLKAVTDYFPFLDYVLKVHVKTMFENSAVRSNKKMSGLGSSKFACLELGNMGQVKELVKSLCIYRLNTFKEFVKLIKEIFDIKDATETKISDDVNKNKVEVKDSKNEPNGKIVAAETKISDDVNKNKVEVKDSKNEPNSKIAAVETKISDDVNKNKVEVKNSKNEPNGKITAAETEKDKIGSESPEADYDEEQLEELFGELDTLLCDFVNVVSSNDKTREEVLNRNIEECCKKIYKKSFPKGEKVSARVYAILESLEETLNEWKDISRDFAGREETDEFILKKVECKASAGILLAHLMKCFGLVEIEEVEEVEEEEVF